VRNLAKHEAPDSTVKDELRQAGIEAVDVGQRIGEVQTTYVGMLGPIVFRRLWTYWSVDGRMPLEGAVELYDVHPVGRKNVRVDGHGIGLPPLAAARHFAKDGREVVLLDKSDQELFAKFDRGELNSETMSRVCLELRSDYHLVTTVAEQQALSDKAYITHYHIDTQEVLNLYAATARKYAEQINAAHPERVLRGVEHAPSV